MFFSSTVWKMAIKLFHEIFSFSQQFHDDFNLLCAIWIIFALKTFPWCAKWNLNNIGTTNWINFGSTTPIGKWRIETSMVYLEAPPMLKTTPSIFSIDPLTFYSAQRHFEQINFRENFNLIPIKFIATVKNIPKA